MDPTSFLSRLDAKRPVPVVLIWLTGSLVTGLALGVFALLFSVGATS
jgi:hypothetical protein